MNSLKKNRHIVPLTTLFRNFNTVNYETEIYLKRPYNTKSAIDMVCRFNGKRFKVGVGLTVKTETGQKRNNDLRKE